MFLIVVEAGFSQIQSQIMNTLMKLLNVAVYAQIFENRKMCEVDPSRLLDGDNLESNLVSCYRCCSHSVYCYLF